VRMNNIEIPLTTFLAIFNTGVDKVPRVAVIHTILDSHILRVRIAGRRECATRDIVPNS
jgi:hypothetical protein